MKRIVFMICLLGGWMTCCFAQGIVFCELTLEAACRQADSEGKYVFVDCYTSWCGPCRQMATREFVKPEAGTYFNEKFVCVKYDMERGEGIQLRERFKVTAYPTFLLLKSNGTEIGRLVGGNELLPFIEKVEYLLKPENSLSLKKERFKAGQLNKKEMMEYVDRLAPEYWNIFTYRLMFPKGRYFDYLEAHQADFVRFVGEEKVDVLLARCYKTALVPFTNATMSSNKFQELDEVLASLKESSFKDKPVIERMAEVAQARCQNDAKRLLKVLTQLMDEQNMDVFGLLC